jgi:hypothetical protein
VIEKFQVNLITNQQDARCEDFYVIDQAEAMIPGRFRATYVEALSAFLQQGSLIKRHMPEKLNIFTRPPKKPTERDGENEIKALSTKLYAIENLAEASKFRKSSEKSKNENAMLKKELEQKMGKCSLCSTFHYFHPKLDQNLP